MADYLGLKKETAHKAKGREWETVRIAGDFRKDKVSREEAMLAYVAVTRAKLVLDREGLAWVDSLAKAPAGAA
jgi:superfamily I DNA/RNA helicase